MRREETSVSILRLLHARCQFATIEPYGAILISVVLIPMVAEKSGIATGGFTG